MEQCEGICIAIAGALDSPHARAKAKVEEERRALVETALLEKVLKNKLALAAEHFNRDYKKSFQYLQVGQRRVLLFLHFRSELPISPAITLLVSRTFPGILFFLIPSFSCLCHLF